METLMDFTELPGEKEYALWSYYGSGTESIWPGFDDFFDSFRGMRLHFGQGMPRYKEYTIAERYEYLVRSYYTKNKLETSETEIITTVNKLVKNFWGNYRQRCYVNEGARTALTNLKNKFAIGVVSNFIVPGGLEELLITNDIRSCINFVVSSADFGWRKPHPLIYEKALSKAGVQPREAIFIGDDLQNDYYGPQSFGFHTLFYDPKDKHYEIKERIMAFKEIEKKIDLI
jgi:putative hydrolase of the HAD superfamily